MGNELKTSHAAQTLVGEARINVLRAVAICALYLQHLISFYILRDQTLPIAFHNSVNLITVVWVCVVAMVFFMLQQYRWPIRLSYFVVFCDAFLISWLVIAAGGPAKIQTVLFLLLVFIAALRLLRSIVWFSVAAGVAGYMTSLCKYVFVDVGYEKYYSADGAALRISRHDEFFMLIAMLVAGVIADQLVLQANRIARATNGEPDSVDALNSEPAGNIESASSDPALDEHSGGSET